MNPYDLTWRQIIGLRPKPKTWIRRVYIRWERLILYSMEFAQARDLDIRRRLIEECEMTGNSDLSRRIGSRAEMITKQEQRIHDLEHGII